MESLHYFSHIPNPGAPSNEIAAQIKDEYAAKSHIVNPKEPISLLAQNALAELRSAQISVNRSELLAAYEVVNKLEPKKISILLRILSIFSSSKRQELDQIKAYNQNFADNWAEKKLELLYEINNHYEGRSPENKLRTAKTWIFQRMFNNTKLQDKMKNIDLMQKPADVKLKTLLDFLQKESASFALSAPTSIAHLNISEGEKERHHEQATRFLDDPDPIRGIKHLREAMNYNYRLIAKRSKVDDYSNEAQIQEMAKFLVSNIRRPEVTYALLTAIIPENSTGVKLSDSDLHNENTLTSFIAAIAFIRLPQPLDK